MTLWLPPLGGRSSNGAQLPGKSVFVESAATTGLNFTHINGATGQYYVAEEMGAGVALFDYDNDGDLDVFLVQGGPLDDKTPADSPTYPTSRLFRNDLTRGPDGKPRLHFTDVTAQAGVGLRAYGMGAAVGDYDNDGDLDLFVTSFGPETLFRNNGNGTFTDVTEEAGISDPLWSTSAAFFDYDRDGDLDLFVANYLDFTIAGNKKCTDSAGAPRLLRPAQLSAGARSPLPQRRQRALHRCDGILQASARADGAGLGVVAADSTTTAGSISTSPTTRRRISSGSIATMARSPMKARSPVPR